MRKHLFILLALIPFTVSATEQQGVDVPFVPVTVKTLPPLNTPRSGHQMFVTGDEVIVMGGHTTGFIPTPTAEYFADGQWHQIPMTYNHDNAIATKLRSGKIFIGGGSGEPLGIEQTFPTEFYDPAKHTFEGYGCMDTKRALATAVEIDNGRIVIAGNWYHMDDIEVYDGKGAFLQVKTSALMRTNPYILRTSADNAIIFSALDTCGRRLPDSDIVDRLHGEAYREPFLRQWHPLRICIDGRNNLRCVSDTTTGDYTYLLPVENDSAQVAIARVSNGTFSLLPTTAPIPMKSPAGMDITYISTCLIDNDARRAYVVGTDTVLNVYILAVDYGAPAPHPLTVYFTEHQGEIPLEAYYTLTNDGNIMFTGGNAGDNYHPLSDTYLLILNDRTADTTAGQTAAWWRWLLIGLSALAIVIIIMVCVSHKSTQHAGVTDEYDNTDTSEDNGQTSTVTNDELLQQICDLMEQQQLFLNSDLKLSDLSTILGRSTRSISDCIKTGRGVQFPQFVNAYRIEYAQQLLRKHPDKKTTEVYIASGFANETSFFRTFKAFTGMTPREWMKKNIV